MSFPNLCEGHAYSLPRRWYSCYCTGNVQNIKQIKYFFNSRM